MKCNLRTALAKYGVPWSLLESIDLIVGSMVRIVVTNKNASYGAENRDLFLGYGKAGKGLPLLPTVRDFGWQLLCALRLLRTAGLIHCDVKPENLLLAPDSCGLNSWSTNLRLPKALMPLSFDFTPDEELVVHPVHWKQSTWPKKTKKTVQIGSMIIYEMCSIHRCHRVVVGAYLYLPWNQRCHGLPRIMPQSNSVTLEVASVLEIESSQYRGCRMSMTLTLMVTHMHEFAHDFRTCIATDENMFSMLLNIVWEAYASLIVSWVL